MSEDFESRVRARANEIWIEEGRPDGRADEHWARAVQEVKAADDAAATPAAAPAETAPAPKRRAPAKKAAKVTAADAAAAAPVAKKRASSRTKGPAKV